ncbi:MAG TPA: hypothetical protein VHJ39_05840 [Solirubrobacteraceae bacterium]|jgi:hypothetical protein|nr:hypothetical protein [Solirubrobacteraceae bacterium]
MSDSHTEPHVSGHELRAALAQNGRTRPNPLMTAEPPAWEWTTDEQVELEELRETVAQLERDVERLRGDTAGSRARERELHDALVRLAAARPWQRKRLVEELSGRGLL